MQQLLKTVSCTAVLCALAGCIETDDGAGGQMPVAPGAPPFIEGSFGASSAAVNACQTALASQTVGGVRVVGSSFSQANSAVYMRVGSNGAPWRCLVSNDGRNPLLEFVGSEGFL